MQTDEVIAMQNGCVCCTSDDLKKQVVDIATSGKFNYMIIELSVSEPAIIADIFGTCDNKDHDHADANVHEDHSIGDVARLDTCVTVVASDQFCNMLQRSTNGSTQQWQTVEANVVIMNK